MTYKDAIRNFAKTLVITTIIIGGISFLIYSNIPSAYYTPMFPAMLGFFLTATLLIFHFMLKAMEKRPARFVNIFMLTTMIKLLSYMSVMLGYALIFREDARPFIIAFFILYIIYTIVEVVSLLNVNKRQIIN